MNRNLQVLALSLRTQQQWLVSRVMMLVLALMLGLGVSGVQAQEALRSADGKTAEEAVEGYIADLLSRLEEVRGLYDTDRDRYFEEIAIALEDFVDFREVARGVMAKYSVGPRGASDEQLTRFAEIFKSSMVDFYGSALTSYGTQDYSIEASRRQSSDPASNTNVRMLVRAGDGSRVELQYSMFLDDDKRWRLKNVYVEGVNLRRQYHSQFDNLMNQYDFDIDATIDNWDAAVGNN